MRSSVRTNSADLTLGRISQGEEVPPRTEDEIVMDGIDPVMARIASLAVVDTSESEMDVIAMIVVADKTVATIKVMVAIPPLADSMARTLEEAVAEAVAEAVVADE